MSQAETQKRFESVKQEVEKRDADIRQLQRSLKESEGLLVSIAVSFILTFIQCSVLQTYHRMCHFTPTVPTDML